MAPGCWERRRWCCRAASRNSCRRPPGWPPAAGGSWCWHAPRARWTASRSRTGLRAAAFVLLAERLRSDAAQTIAYFAAQGVALKVISGDSPLTVSAVAARAGLPDADQPVDARDLPEDPGALGRLLEERSVFGRVSPQQKQAMVTALQARGHTVAMTGDGVNDVVTGPAQQLEDQLLVTGRAWSGTGRVLRRGHVPGQAARASPGRVCAASSWARR